MVREVHIAIIGAGYWGQKLIDEYLSISQENPHIKLSAIVDISRENLERTSKKYGLPPSMLYTDLRYVIENNEINAVHIATPNETHFEIASLMLEHDKHVLLEKPMALSSRDAFKLVRLAEIYRRVLLVGHIFRFNNALIQVRNLLKTGELGDISYIDLIWTTHLYPPPHNRDIIFDLAPHPIDIINFLLDTWPHEVYVHAHSPIRRQKGHEEYAYALLKLPKNMTALIKLSWLEHGPKKRWVSIVTDKASIFIDVLSQDITLYYEAGKAMTIPIEPSNTIREMIMHFMENIAWNSPPNNSGLIGALTVMVLEAMKRSHEENRPVQIPL